MPAPPFDPNAPFETITETPPFDPTKPFEEVTGQGFSQAKGELSKLSAGLTPQVSQGRAALEGALSGASLGFRDEALAAARASGLPEWLGGLRIPVGAARLGYEALTQPGTATEAYGRARTDIRGIQKAAQEQYPATYLASEVGGSLASAALPVGLAARGASVPGTIGRGAAIGAGLGTVQGAGEAPELADIPAQSAGGALIGGALGAAIPAAAVGVRRAISPFSVPAERRAATQVLAKEGVPVSAGQQVGDRAKGLRYLENEFGGANFRDTQLEKYTSAVLKRAGIDATSATTDVIDGAFNRLGNEFESFRNNVIKFTPKLNTEIGAVEAAYNKATGTATRAPFIGQVVSDLQSAAAQYGNIPGALYANTRSEITDVLRTSTDGALKNSAKSLLSAIDDAMERSLPKSEVERFRLARNQYRNLIPISQAAAGAGEQAAEGMITPQRLRQALVANSGSRAYARGSGDLNEITRAGNVVMGNLPQSGTGQRLSARIGAQVIGHAVPGIFGAGAGGAEGGGEGAAAGALFGLAAPTVAGRVALSRLGRNFLTNRLLPGQPGNLPALLSQGVRAPALQLNPFYDQTKD